MIEHKTLGESDIMNQIKSGAISHAGNTRLKIYGKLNCKSGKRMKVENRVFFESEEEALTNGFRPCAHCMNTAYLNWKHGII